MHVLFIKAVLVNLKINTNDMKAAFTLLLLLGLIMNTLNAQEDCLASENLKSLDASWEKAQLELDFDYLETLLADDFIWVHNHANTTDDKTAVLDRVKRNLDRNIRNTKSRNSKDVKVIIYDSTGIVSGFTVVDRGPTPTNYNFMRTYVKSNGKCYLLANHTMAIPEGNND